MKKYLLSFLFLSLLSAGIYGQTIQLQGRITDKNSGSCLPYATVHSAKEAVYANELGYYTFQYLAQGLTDSISFQFIGYQSVKIPPPEAGHHTINIALESNLKLPTIEVRASNLVATGGGIIAINIERLKLQPVLGGEEDLIKSLTNLPGITTGVEGTANIQIRGGSADQTQLLIDGSPVYYANHLGGFLSAVAPYSIKGLTVYKAGVPAKYGGRLSGMVDILLQDGDQEKTTGEASIGTATLRAGIKTRIGKRGRFHSSVRYAYPSAVIDLVSVGNYKKGVKGNKFNFSIYDIIAKYSLDIDATSSLSASYFQSGDHGTVQDVFSTELNLDDFRWSNQTAAIRWFKSMGNNFSLLVNPVFSKFKYKYEGLINDVAKPDSIVRVYLTQTRSDIEDFGLRTQLGWQLNNKIGFEAGFMAIYHRLSTTALRTLQYEDELIPRLSTISKGWEQAIYISQEAQFFNDKLNISSGLRFSRFTGNLIDKKWIVEPRIRLQYSFIPTLSINAGYEEHKQFNHQLEAEGSLLPNNIWVLAEKDAPGSSSSQLYIGLSGKITRHDIEWYVEAYTKKYDNLIQLAFGQDNIYNSEQDWTESIFNNGTGDSRGIEFFVANNGKKWKNSLAYTLSYSNRQFAQINEGATFPFIYDRRHIGNVSTSFIPNSKWSFSLLWTYQTGNAVTLPKVRAGNTFIFGDYNGQRMPDFHRLDFSATKSWTAKKRDNRLKSLTFSLYNAYNRANPHEILIRPVRQNVVTETGDTREVTIWKTFQLSLFPIIPSLSYKIQFLGNK